MSGQRPVEWVPVSSRLRGVTVVTPRRAGKSLAARRARTAALLQERAAIEWDVLSRISMRRRVRDVLGGCPGPRCGRKRPPRAGLDVAAFCSRREGHTGRHLMGAGAWVVAVWS